MSSRPLVTIIDDDESVRESLPDLVNLLGYEARAYSSAEAFLASRDVKASRCLVLDIAMPGMSGPELVGELRRSGHKTPVVFITAHRDEAGRLPSHLAGIIHVLFKPFSDTALAAALEKAMTRT